MNKNENTFNEVKWDKEVLSKIIEKGDTKFLNGFCYEIGQYYVKQGLSTHQIRKVLDDILSMDEYEEAGLQLLRPKLAYIAGRHQRTTPVIKNHFQPMLDQAIQMTNKENFKNFKNFIEAIVAYHRYHGGKE